MKERLGLIVSLAALLATGCGTKPATSPIAAAPLPSVTGNWQIQSSSPSPATPTLGVVLLGALQNTGAQVTGTFRFANLAQVSLPNGCALNQVVTVTGTVDAMGDLALTSAALPDGTVVTAQLLLPAVLTGFAKGTIAVSGKTCAFASAPAIGVEIASVTGKFSGPLTPVATLSAPGPAGTGTLTLTQSTTPAHDGQFPITGTLAYTLGTCSGTTSLSGTVSGVGLDLTYMPISFTTELLPSVRMQGLVVASADSISVRELLITESPCPAAATPLLYSYSGTLTRQ